MTKSQMSTRRVHQVGYWAVRVGHVPGIYSSWGDCQKHVTNLEPGVKCAWKRFEHTSDGFEKAKKFCKAENEANEANEEANEANEEEITEEDLEEDKHLLLVRLETNWTREKQHARLNKELPYYAVVFNMSLDDDRNLFDYYQLPQPTEERCILMALLAFLQWCQDPNTALHRRGHDGIKEYEDIVELDTSMIRHIIVQTPCKRLENMFEYSVSGSVMTKTSKGMARTIQRHLEAILRDFAIVVEFITVSESAADE